MVTFLVPKFKVQCRVQDSTGSLSFVMFDKDVSKILGVSASDIRDRQLKSGDVEAFPNEIHALHNKLFAFKIWVSEYNPEKKYRVYTIGKVCDDSELIAELRGGDQDEGGDEETDPLAVKLDDSSQIGIDSKDAASVTGDCLTIDAEKDSATSPGIKRHAPFVLDDNDLGDASTSRTVKKKLLV